MKLLSLLENLFLVYSSWLIFCTIFITFYYMNNFIFIRTSRLELSVNFSKKYEDRKKHFMHVFGVEFG